MNDSVEELVEHATPSLSGPIGRALEVFGLGGPVAIILVGTSVVALAIILAKLWQFGVLQIGNLRAAYDALELYRGDKAHDALLVARKSRNPVAIILTRAIRGKQQSVPETSVREEVMRQGNASLESLRSGFRALEIIAALAPLLGLFGTVLGMIEAFREMEQAGNQVNPAVLSGGIWTALLTTALGLGVAMPVVVILAWLERRVEQLAHAMSYIVTGIFTVELPEHTLKEKDLDSPRLQARPIMADS